MPSRRRLATRDEMINLLAEDDLDTELVRRVVERLAEFGVPVEALVRITVVEEV